MKWIGLTILFFTILTFNTKAQEFDCRVSVELGQNVQTSAVDRTVFQEIEESAQEFINNTRWTQDVFQPEERIECEIQILIERAPSNTNFSGSIQVIASRPVFNSSYKTSIFNYRDQDFTIQYLRGARFQFFPNQHTNNFTSILAFYAYMVLGYDYDSFSPEGGTPFFEQAQQIVTNAANAAESGWKAAEGNKNRYWLVDNALHNVFKPLRECYYQYHHKGLDIMHEDVNKGRAKVLQALEMLKQVQQNRPLSFNLQIFFSAKLQELMGMFKEAFPQEKTKAVQLLKSLNPSNSSQYEKLLRD